MDSSIIVLEAGGTPDQVGRTLGEAMQPHLGRWIHDSWRNFHEIFKHKSLTYLPWERYLSLGARYLPFAQEYAPELVDELRAQADAGDVPFGALFAHNCFLDFDDLAYPFLADQILFGCTAFAATAQVTADGRCFLGQNYDYRSVFKSTSMVLRLKPERGPQSLVWTMGGLAGCAGVNSAGVSVVINNLIPSDSRPGVPHAFVVRKILQQERLGDAVAVVTGARRATGINYILADASGEVLALETSATDYRAIYPTEGYIAHANTYLADTMRSYERFRLPYNTDSVVRYGRMVRLLAEHAPHIALADLQGFLSDHMNYPYGICRHEAEGVEEDLLGKTIGSFIMEPTSCTMYVADGNPCSLPFHALTLR